MPEDMAAVIDAVEPATAALPVAPASTPNVPTGPSRVERIDALRGPARDAYRLDGNLEAAELKMGKKSDAAVNADHADSSTADDDPDTSSQEGTVETAPAPGTGKREQPKSQRQQFAELREAKTKAEARAELLERQLAESRKPATVDDKKLAVQAEVPSERPKRPRFSDYSEGDVYDAAMDKYELDLDAWNNRNVDQRLTGVKAEQQQQLSQAKLAEQFDAARKEFPDYDAVAFNENAPASFAMIHILESLENGAKVRYHVGKDLKLAAQIAELTYLPGEEKFTSYSEFQKWVKADPERAMAYGERRAIAKQELSKIKVQGTAAPKPQRPLKEVIAAHSRPSAEVDTDGSASPVNDPIQEALKKAHATGDNRDYNRLMNAKEIRERKEGAR